MFKYRGVIDAGIFVRGMKEFLFAGASKNNLDINIETEGFFNKTYMFTVYGDQQDITNFIKYVKYYLDEYNSR